MWAERETIKKRVKTKISSYKYFVFLKYGRIEHYFELYNFKFRIVQIFIIFLTCNESNPFPPMSHRSSLRHRWVRQLQRSIWRRRHRSRQYQPWINNIRVWRYLASRTLCSMVWTLQNTQRRMGKARNENERRCQSR